MKAEGLLARARRWGLLPRSASEVLTEAFPGQVHSGVLKMLFELARPYWRSLLPVMTLIFAGAAAEALTAALYVPLFQILAGGVEAAPKVAVGPLFEISSRLLKGLSLIQQVGLLASAWAVGTLLRSALGYAASLASSRFTLSVERDLRQRMLELYLGAEYQFFLDRSQGRLLDDLLEQPRRASSALTLFLGWGQMFVTAAGLVTVLVAISWQATLAATVFGIAFSLSLWGLRLRAQILGRGNIMNQREIKNLSAEMLSGIRQVKLFGAEARVIEQNRQLLDERVRLAQSAQTLSLLPGVLSQGAWGLLLPGAMAAVVVIAPERLTGLLPVLGALWIVASRVFPLVAALSTDRLRFYSQAHTMRFVLDVLHYTPSERGARETDGGGRRVDQIKTGIAFERISFRYTRSHDAGLIPERPKWVDFAVKAQLGQPPADGHDQPEPIVLNNVNLEFLGGRMTALVGPSGSGKTTVVDLLARLFSPQDGRITMDGADIRQYDLKSWRQAIGYVSQDTFIFSGTIRENIAFSKPDASFEAIQRAACIANAEEFIARLPAGYDTVVGDRGMKLSGGQRQRIAIARAILRDPPILIFDEATSSLDTVAERMVQAGIEAASRDRTAIVIAHRLSTIIRADRIYVIDGGRVVESGRHDELIEAGGIYWRLYFEPGRTADSLEEDILAEGKHAS